MLMSRIEAYQAFAAIVEKPAVTPVARHLRRPPQSASRSLLALGAQHRRRACTAHDAPIMSHTDAGLAFYNRLSAAPAEIEATKVETENRRAEASGLLRIAGSNLFSPLYIVPALPEFLATHPKVQIELQLSDGYIDLIGEGCDLAILIGELPDSTLKAKLLANSRRVVFAAPSYFAKYGRPRSPEDLTHHECIVRTAAHDGGAWPFQMNGRVKTVKVAGRLRTNGALAVNEAVAQGLGIANATLWSVRSLVDRGAVEVVLTRFEPLPLPFMQFGRRRACCRPERNCLWNSWPSV
jgi:DNA-binding transcriptional LysR family regulator